MSSERTIGVRHVVFTVPFMYPYGFKKILSPLNDMHLTIVGDHIFVEFYATNGILSCEKISLSIIVNKYTRVNKVTVADYSRTVYRKQWFPDRIRKRTLRILAYRHSDMLLVGRVVEVVFPVSEDAVRSPCFFFCPHGL